MRFTPTALGRIRRSHPPHRPTRGGESPLRPPVIAFIALVVAAAFVVVPRPDAAPLDAHGLPIDMPTLAMKEPTRPELDDATDPEIATADSPSAPMRLWLVANGQTHEQDALNGTLVVKADEGVLVKLLTATRAGTEHELRYGGDEPWKNAATAIRFESDGVHMVANVTRAHLANLSSADLTFVVATTTGGITKPSSFAGRDGKPFHVVVDTDPPRMAAQTGAVSGANVQVVWAGADRESAIAWYRAQFRENGGAWQPWISEIHETGATYSGKAGATYAFRLAAVDSVGHLSEWATTDAVKIDERAPANRAPTLELLAPADGIATRAIEVAVLAADPDATTPLVKACASVEGGEQVCAPESTSSILPLDVSALPDGPVTIRVGASDGSLSAPPIDRTVTLDRAPPTMRDVRAEPAANGASLSLVSEATAVNADVARADGTRVGTIPLASEAGVWTATPELPPGDYEIVFAARDAAGNVGEVVERLSLPAADAPAPESTHVDASAPPAPETVAPQSQQRTPLPVVASLAGALLVALARRRA